MFILIGVARLGYSWIAPFSLVFWVLPAVADPEPSGATRLAAAGVEALGSWDKVRGGVKKGAQKVKEGVREGYEKAKEGVKKGANKTKEGVDKAADKVQEKLD